MRIITYTKLHANSIGVFLILTCVLSICAGAQNTNKATYIGEDISKISIDGNSIFTISIKTSETDQISIESLIDGEYGNTFKVITEEKNGQLHIALKRASLNIAPDDKRNAHKVVAATLKLDIPANKDIDIVSDIGSADLQGTYNTIALKLFDRNFNFNGIAKSAKIETRDGHISIKTSDALVETDSHHGLVKIPNDMFGYNVFKLKTHGGNITVTKIE